MITGNIFINNRSIDAIYVNGREIEAVYKDGRLIWKKGPDPVDPDQPITPGGIQKSCYSNGYWLDEYPWLDELYWND